MSYNNNTLLPETNNLHQQKARMTDEEAFAELCRRYFRCQPHLVRKFFEGLPDFADSMDCLPTVKKCLPEIERWPGECKKITTQVDECMHFFKESSCAAQYLYGQVTMTHHSQDMLVPLDQVVQGLGGDYVNAFPVAAGKRIRLRQIARPGYRPLFIRGDFNLDNNSLAYSDISLEFFIGNQSIGSVFSGDNLVQKSGNQLKLDFPKYLTHQLIVGSNELLEVELVNNSVNALQSAHIRVHHDTEKWTRECATTC